MMQHFITDILPELPLFQGLGRIDLQQFATTIPHTMATFKEGTRLVSQDDACKQLIIVHKGTVVLRTCSDNKRYIFEERLQGPIALQVATLYGISPYSMYTITAQTEVQALILPKESVTLMMSLFDVFRINLINQLSTQLFRSRKWVWHEMGGNTGKRIVNFLRTHSYYPAGEKILNISMEDLGKQINETRMNVSCALNAMQKENLIVLKRRTIVVPNLEKLLKRY